MSRRKPPKPITRPQFNPAMKHRHPNEIWQWDRHPRFVPLEERFWSRVEKTDTCWLWMGPKMASGHGHLKKQGSRILAHRLSLEFYLGRKIQDGMFVCHKCNNPPCVNPDHLYEGSHSDNMRDAVRAGTHYASKMPNVVRNKGVPKRRGSNNYQAKFTEEQVKNLRQRNHDGVSGAVLAREYRVNRATMNNLLSGRTWKHVT